MNQDQVDHVVTAMARQVPPDAFVGVGLGTPSALVASVMGTNLRGGHVLAGGAIDVDPPVDRWFGGPDTIAGHTAGYVSHFESMEWAEKQTMTMQFLRPAQVDGAGNLNTSRLGTATSPTRRFPGGLATGDVTQVLPRVVAYLPFQQTRNTPEEVAFITGTGAPTSAGGYHSNGVAALVTDLGVIEWHDGAATLAAHPWVAPEEVEQRTGFAISISGTGETAPPTKQELAALEHIDPQRIRDRELLRQA